MHNEIDKTEEEIYQPAEPSFKAIKEWRVDDRPRERLATHGAHTLSDAELLAIIIGYGTKSFSALDVARDLLDKYEDLTKLSSTTLSQLKRTKGIGDVKAINLAAAFELGKRIESAPFDPAKQITSPDIIAQFYIPRLRGLKKEIFRVLLLSASNHVMKEIIVSEGILNASLVHPREVFGPAVIEGAASIIIMHNHPSGNPTPSKEDIEITKTLIEAGKIMDIKIIDHIIIAGDNYTSFIKEGLI